MENPHFERFPILIFYHLRTTLIYTPHQKGHSNSHSNSNSNSNSKPPPLHPRLLFSPPSSEERKVRLGYY